MADGAETTRSEEMRVEPYVEASVGTRTERLDMANEVD